MRSHWWKHEIELSKKFLKSNTSKMPELSQILRGCSVVARPQVARSALCGSAFSAFSGFCQSQEMRWPASLSSSFQVFHQNSPTPPSHLPFLLQTCFGFLGCFGIILIKQSQIWTCLSLPFFSTFSLVSTTLKSSLRPLTKFAVSSMELIELDSSFCYSKACLRVSNGGSSEWKWK